MHSVSSINFQTRIWPEIVKRISMAFRFNQEEAKRLGSNKTAKLISAIPHLAGCRNPMRTSCSHLGTYLLARDECRDLFNHSLDDNCSLLKRLQLINNFEGGNTLIIRRGMNLLSLNMIWGYKRDMLIDPIYGKYNPIADGAWNFKEIESSLIAEIELVPCKEMDAIMSIEESKTGSWNGT